MKTNIMRHSSLLIIGIILILFNRYVNLELFKNIYSLISPLIIGAVISYFLLPIVKVLERWFDKHDSTKKHKKGLSIFIVCILFILLLVTLIMFIVPACLSMVSSLLQNMNDYIVSFEKMVHQIPNADMQNILVKGEKKVISKLNDVGNTNPQVYISYVTAMGTSVVNAIIGMIFVPYILFERGRLLNLADKIFGIWLDDDAIHTIHHAGGECNKIFGRFVYGKFLDSCIIGIMALIFFMSMDIPFAPVMAFIILVTNMIPCFGPFIGGVPVSIFVLITVGIWPCACTGFFIFILQQFDGFFLGPLILGDAVGISSFWVLLSIIVFGRLWGFVGMFIAVPLTCMLRKVLNTYIDYNNKMKKRTT